MSAVSVAAIDEPLERAQDGIVFRSVLLFVAVASPATVPLLLRMPAGAHGLAHLLLPAAWVAYATVVWLRSRSQVAHVGDAWLVAREINADGFGAARAAALALPVGWLAAGAGLLVHHLAAPAGAGEVIGIYLPLMLAAWWLAQSAWQASCRHLLCRAFDERAVRLHEYARFIGPRTTPGGDG